MAELGPKALINPKEIFSSFIKCGLITDSHGSADKTPLVSQREALLHLALEYHLPFFFIKCMKEWRYSDSSYEYCTSRSILNWAWKKVLFIKSSIDRMCVTLFNCSGYDVDKSSIKSLYGFRKQLHLIDSIIACFQKYVTPRSEQGTQDLECRREALSCINIYLQVLLWLRSVHVLPEVCEEEATAENVAFKVDNIVKCYGQRRSALQDLNSSIGATDVLLIDGLVKEVGIRNAWQEKGGSGNYPPPSIYAALGVYLLNGISIEWKHALTYYLLLDLIKYSENENFKNEIKKFPVMFDMPKCVSKLVEAFWYLDRKDCSNAIKQLFDPAIKSSDILVWQNSRIMKSFLYYSSPENALKYMEHMTPPQNTFEDIRLYLSVLLSCGAVSQAFEYQRKRQTDECAKELLRHLFLGCLETGKMQELMYLPLNNYESSTLIEFLSENDNPKAQEGLVMYHLLHCNFFEAQKTNEKLSIFLMKNRYPETSVKERTTGRVTLVDSLLSGISITEMALIREINRLPPKTTVIEESLKPLSVFVKANSMKKVTYAGFLTSLVEETSLIDTNAQTPKRFGSQPDIKELPFLRHINTPEAVRTPSVTESEKNVMNKRSMLATSPNDYSTPAKRSRLLDNATFMETSLSKKKTPKHLAGDIASLLHTPPIHRRVSLLKSIDYKGTPEKPASILKKLSMYEVEQDARMAETPPLEEIPASEGANSEEENMQVDDKVPDMPDLENDNLLKQLRFDVPMSEQSLCESVAAVSETSFVEDDSNSVLVEHPEEVGNNWRKSMPTLTREPLVEYRKHSAEPAAKAQDVAEESEILKDNLESSFLSTTSQLSTAKQFEAAPVVEILDISSEVEIIEDHTPDEDSDSVVEVLQMETDISKNNFGLLSSTIRSAAPDYFSLASQRKTPSPRPPLRSETSAMDIQEVPLYDFESGPSSDVTSCNKDSKISLPNLLQDDNTIIDDSDMEIFYSPSSSGIESFSDKLAEEMSHSIVGQEIASNTLGTPQKQQSEKNVPPSRHFVFTMPPVASLLQDVGKSQSAAMKLLEKTDAEIELLCATMEPPDQADPEIQLLSVHPSQSNVQQQASLVSSKTYICGDKSGSNPQNTKPSHPKYVFSKPPTIIETREEVIKVDDSKLGTNTVPKSYLSKDSNKSGHKTFTVSKPTESFSDVLGQKDRASIICDAVQIGCVENSQKDKVETEKSVQPSRNTITISKQLPTTSTIQVIDGKIVQSVSVKPPDKTFVCDYKLDTKIETLPDSSQCDVQKSASAVSSKTYICDEKSTAPPQTMKGSRKPFVFSKPHFVTETHKTGDSGLEKNTVPKKSEDESKTKRESKTAKPRNTFTFSRPIPAPEAVEDDPPSHSKEPETVEIVCNTTEYKSKLSIKTQIGSGVTGEIVQTETKVSHSKDSINVNSSNLISHVTDKSDKTAETSSIDSKKTSSKLETGKPSQKYFFTRELRSTTSAAKTTAPTKEIPANTEQIDANSTNKTTEPSSGQTDWTSQTVDPSKAHAVGKTISSDSGISITGQIDYSVTTAVVAEEDVQNANTNKTSPLKMVITRNEGKSDVSSIAINVQSSKVNEVDMDVEMTETASSKNTKFLRSIKPESYAEFSSLLSKGTPRKGKEESPKKILSSPRKDEEVASFKTSTDKKIPSKSSGRIRKKKTKGKNKMQFSFAEPTSPATPDILEVLDKTPAQDKQSEFLFSPPLTRGRLRQKKNDETFGSSFSSMVSDISYSASFRQPTIEPILEDKIQESSTLMKGTPKKAERVRSKKRNTNKSRLQDSVLEQSQVSVSETTSSNLSLLNSPQRHSMRLRAKQKPDH